MPSYVSVCAHFCLNIMIEFIISVVLMSFNQNIVYTILLVVKNANTRPEKLISTYIIFVKVENHTFVCTSLLIRLFEE